MNDDFEGMTEGNKAVKDYLEIKSSIILLLKDLAEYYSITLSDRQLDMYSDDLVEMGFKGAFEAIVAYRKDWYSDKFPLPARIRKQVYFSSK